MRLIPLLTALVLTTLGFAQSAQDLLDKAMSLQTAASSFHGTSASRSLTLKLLRKENDPMASSRYIIQRQEYTYSEVRMRPPADWAYESYSQNFSTDFTSPSINRTRLLKINNNKEVGRLTAPGIFTITDYSNHDFESPLRYALIGSTDLKNTRYNIVYSQLHPEVRQQGNRLWGLSSPEIQQSHVVQGTTTYCIRAKNNDEEVVFVWLNDRDFQITRVITLSSGHIGQGLLPYGFIKDGYVTTSLVIREYNYTYLPPLFPTEESFTEFNDLTTDFSQPANREQFLPITDIIKLTADQFTTTAEESFIAPRTDKSWSTDLRKGRLIVETGKYTTSGFIARIKDIDFAITNLQAINSDSRVTLKTMDGKEIPYTAIYGVIGRDIALFKISKNQDALKLADTPGQTGQRVTLMRNKSANGSPDDQVGLLTHIGLDRIETHKIFYIESSGTPFYASGSPLISDDTGEVLGVVTCRQSTWIDILKQAETNQEIRPYGYIPQWFAWRLDGNLSLQAINLLDWHEQRKRIEKFRILSDRILSTLKLRIEDLKDDARLFALLNSFITRINATGNDAAFYTGESTRIIKSLLLLADEDMRPMASTQFYDYYRSCLYWDQNALDQIRYRAAIITALKSYEANPLILSARLHAFANRQKK